MTGGRFALEKPVTHTPETHHWKHCISELQDRFAAASTATAPFQVATEFANPDASVVVWASGEPQPRENLIYGVTARDPGAVTSFGAASLMLVVAPERPDAPAGDWRSRLNQVRVWRGDERLGEPSVIPEIVIRSAEWIANYAEMRMRRAAVTVPTVIAPMADGGIHIEWNVRTDSSVSHFEIEIAPDRLHEFETLRTEETPAGAILYAYEISDASLPELLTGIEELLARAHRV